MDKKAALLGGGEPVVPDVEGAGDLVAEPAAGLLEQGVALPHDAIDVLDEGPGDRIEQGEGVVHQLPPAGGTTPSSYLAP